MTPITMARTLPPTCTERPPLHSEATSLTGGAGSRQVCCCVFVSFAEAYLEVLFLSNIIFSLHHDPLTPEAPPVTLKNKIFNIPFNMINVVIPVDFDKEKRISGPPDLDFDTWCRGTPN